MIDYSWLFSDDPITVEWSDDFGITDEEASILNGIALQERLEPGSGYRWFEILL